MYYIKRRKSMIFGKKPCIFVDNGNVVGYTNLSEQFFCIVKGIHIWKIGAQSDILTCLFSPKTLQCRRLS